ncbi:hypothetical protein [Streptomyces sp. NPDC088254]|uniref:hypothetical protein n=1 Tax=Streptomyces sp. NPDC088254 TaxID=3365847 RepID=UPI00381E676D
MQNGAMDAGLAAVLGAAVGAIGSGGAAFATGLWAGRQTRWQVDGQQTIAREQVRFEHLKDRREPRSVAYSALIAFMQNLSTDAHAALHALLAEEDDKVREFEDSLTTRRTELNSVFARVCVEGPEGIVTPATTEYRHARDFTFRVNLMSYHSRSAPTQEVVDEMDQRFNDIEEMLNIPTELFIDAAREILDDHGAPPEPH